MLGHPTYLPDLPREGQDELWTPELRRRIINVVVETGVAMEISTRYQAPHVTLVREACRRASRWPATVITRARSGRSITRAG